MTNASEKYISAVRYLNDLYDFFNLHIFESALSKPCITIQPDAKNKALGWFSVSKVWKENAEDEGANEINISAQFLNRPAEQVAETMLHEMCHQYAQVNKLQDTSRSGVYHNKLFKKIAEVHGLSVAFAKTIGWSHTEFNDTTRELFKTFSSEHKLIFRLPPVAGQVKISSTRKYQCPYCGQSVRATKQVNIMCADCDELMREVD